MSNSTSTNQDHKFDDRCQDKTQVNPRWLVLPVSQRSTAGLLKRPVTAAWERLQHLSENIFTQRCLPLTCCGHSFRFTVHSLFSLQYIYSSIIIHATQKYEQLIVFFIFKWKQTINMFLIVYIYKIIPSFSFIYHAALNITLGSFNLLLSWQVGEGCFGEHQIIHLKLQASSSSSCVFMNITCFCLLKYLFHTHLPSS